MKKATVFILILLASDVIAQEPDSTSALFKMREAECNFARASVMNGRNAAFVEYFADESILFTDKWITNGKEYWEEKKKRPVVLKWEPEFMDISAGRDFGISTGPWEMQEYRPNTAPLATGYFLTVWKEQSNGTWKVILDAGSETPPPDANKHSFSFPEEADKALFNPAIIDTKITNNELAETEKQFMMAWKNNPVPDTYASFLAPDARIQLSGHLPLTNTKTIAIGIAQLDKTINWTTEGYGAASSGDLGFTYGYLEIANDLKGTKGHYVRIWRKQPFGKWAIEIEMLNID
jgi:ketosteroid isomerase-like protein